MNELATRLEPVSVWFLMIVHSLWQGGFIVAIALLAAWSLPGAPSHVRYRIWVMALVFLTLCPLETWRRLALRSGESSRIGAALRTDGSDSNNQLSTDGHRSDPVTLARTGGQALVGSLWWHDIADRFSGKQWRSWADVAFLCYAVGVLLLLARLVLSVCGGRRLIRRAVPIHESHLLTMVRRRAEWLGLRTIPEIRACLSVTVPTVVGILRPAILLPLSVVTQLNLDQLETIMIHELAHIRRWDHAVNLWQRVMEAFLFYHPAVWWISRMIRIEREQCCDEIVLKSNISPVVYARSLLQVAQFDLERQGRSVALATGLGAVGRPSRLRQRIARMLDGGVRQDGRLVRVWPLVLAVGSFIVLGGWAYCPQFANAQLQLAQSDDEVASSPDSDADKPGGVQVNLVHRELPEGTVRADLAARAEKRDPRAVLAMLEHLHAARVSQSRGVRIPLPQGESVTMQETIVSAEKPLRVDDREIVAQEFYLNLPEGSGLRAEVAGKSVRIESNDRTRFVIESGFVRILDAQGVVRATAQPASEKVVLEMEANMANDEVVMRVTNADQATAGEDGALVRVRLDNKTGIDVDAPATHGSVRYELQKGDDLGPIRFKMQWTYDVAKLHADGESKAPSNDSVIKDPSSPEPEFIHVDENRRFCVHGRITGPDGRPLEGVDVRANTGIGTLHLAERTRTDSNGNYVLQLPSSSYGPSIVAATIFAAKPGYYERNLCRQGDYVMAESQPKAEDYAGYVGVLLPKRPQKIDFEMAPAINVAGTISLADGTPASAYRIALQGPDLPPSSSVMSSDVADESGHFQLKDVPTTYSFQILVEPREAKPPWLAWASPTLRFSGGVGGQIVVTDPAGRSIAGERLAIELQGEGLTWREALARANKDDGRLVFGGAPYHTAPAVQTDEHPPPVVVNLTLRSD